jgi:hypothetical protein
MVGASADAYDCGRISPFQRALKRFKRRGMMLSESRLSLQCKIQTSRGFFPESYFPEIAGIVVGVFLYLVERDRRRLPRCSRHILRRQRENEGSGIGRPGSVDQAELAADVAFYIEQFKPLRHLALYKAGTGRPPLILSRGRYAKAAPRRRPRQGKTQGRRARGSGLFQPSDGDGSTDRAIVSNAGTLAIPGRLYPTSRRQPPARRDGEVGRAAKKAAGRFADQQGNTTSVLTNQIKS